MNVRFLSCFLVGVSYLADGIRAEPVEFAVDPSLSKLNFSMQLLTPLPQYGLAMFDSLIIQQERLSLRASYSGSILAEISSQSVTVLGGTLDAEAAGPFSPGTVPGEQNYGFTSQFNVPFDLDGTVNDVKFTLLGGTTFQLEELVFGAILDGAATPSAVNFGPAITSNFPNMATVTPQGGGLYKISVPIDLDFSTSLDQVVGDSVPLPGLNSVRVRFAFKGDIVTLANVPEASSLVLVGVLTIVGAATFRMRRTATHTINRL